MLRRMLWPGSTEQDHHREIADRLNAGEDAAMALIARDDGGEAVGFVEASLRREPVNGCDTSPVLFLEGIYVVPACRRRGTARSLCVVIETWGRLSRRKEFGSDALLDNATSHAFHAALGFEECERVVFFARSCDRTGEGK